MIDAARKLAAAGIPIFPAGRDKTPLTTHGFKDATTDLLVIERYWTANPSTNIAIRCGQASGLVVIDVDGDEGADNLHAREREHGTLPRTTSATTPRGGSHFYFAHPGFPIKPSVGEIAPAVDVRADGSYVLAPPSSTDHGCYAWDVEMWPPAAMPAWLIELTRADRADGDGSVTPPSVWLDMLEAGIPDGRRNVDLTRFTGYLLGHYIAVDVAAEIVHMVNERCPEPKPRGEVDQIINSVAGMELRRRERKQG